MVAVIKTGHSLQRILHYNENKVKEGVAECIGEKNYPMEVTAMNLVMKLNRLVHQAELNMNVTRNSVHISLNFDASESGLEKLVLVDIANEYMEKIGFGQQPYLIYQHYDAGHPHIHIVSVKVRRDGTRIDMQNIGKNQSEKARREIEKKYGLVVAGNEKQQGISRARSHPAKVIYGKTDSKRAITNVLNAVVPNYKFTSLHELNAVLCQYNITADRGSERSRMFQAQGLVYRILDEKGNKVGIPIKASSIYNKPMLSALEKRYGVNEIARQSSKGRIKNCIDHSFLGKKIETVSFCKALEKEGINVVLRQNEEGKLYGITYVDHVTRCVFNGSALGKQYSAKGIQERCADNDPGRELLSGAIKDTSGNTTAATEKQGNELFNSIKSEDLLAALSRPENALDYIPKQLKKKRKRKGQSDNR